MRRWWVRIALAGIVGAGHAALAGPADVSVENQKQETLDTIIMVCEQDHDILCPSTASDPGYCMPDGQSARIFHPICNPTLTIDPTCTLEPAGALPCVPLLGGDIIGCAEGDTTNCARLRVEATYVPVQPWAWCEGQPDCANLEIVATVEVLGSGYTEFSATREFTHPSGFRLSNDCNDFPGDGVRIGDWFPFPRRECIFQSGLGWGGLILAGNEPVMPSSDPDAAYALASIEDELASWGEGYFGLPSGTALPTLLRDWFYPTANGTTLPGQVPIFGVADRYDDHLDFVYQAGTYPLPLGLAMTNTNMVPTVEQQLAGSATGDQFGIALDVDGDTLVVGAPGRETAFVFERFGSSWLPAWQLFASDGVSGDGFGRSVAVDGDVVIVGAPTKASSAGAIYVFRRTGSSWSQEQKLLPADPAASRRFGHAVDVEGKLIVVGRPEPAVGTGSAYVFRRGVSVWAQEKKLLVAGGATDDNFGDAVGVSGNRIAVGASKRDVTSVADAGRVYVYRYDGADWPLQSDFSPLTLVAAERFGRFLDMDADRLLIGTAPLRAAYPFRGTNGSWVQEARLTRGSGQSSFGAGVSVDRHSLVVGNPNEASSRGTARRYRWNGSLPAPFWGHAESLQASFRQANDFFGEALALSDRSLVVGARRAGSSPGAVFAYTLPPQTILRIQGSGTGGEFFSLRIRGSYEPFWVFEPGGDAASIAQQVAAWLGDRIYTQLGITSVAAIGARVVLDGIDPSEVSVDYPGDAVTVAVGDNDRPEDAFPVGLGTTTTTLQGAGQDFTSSSPDCYPAGQGSDVWYTYTASAHGLLLVDTCGTQFGSGLDSYLSLHDLEGGEVTCNDDYYTSTDDPVRCALSGGIRDAFVQATMVPGQTLRIRASRYYAAADGSLAMNVDFDRADCNDGADNDGDGLFDLLDPGCSGAADAEETAPSRICDNGLDDDGDGRVDYRVDGSGDLGCWDGSSTSETTQCQDGLDNDGQPGIDFDGGASLDLDSNGFVDVEFNPATPPVGAADPECTRAFRNKEASGCGLGFEIALLAPLLGRLERKRRARRPGA